MVMLLCWGISVKGYSQNFSNITVGEFFQIVSRETGVDFFPDVEVKDELIDINFSQEQDTEELIEKVSEIYHLKISPVKDVYVVSKKNNTGDKYAIYGTVRPQGYAGTIDGVKITITDNHTTSYRTDFGGKYIIPNIEPGVYIIRFEKEGYIPRHEFINVKEKIMTLNISLKRDNSLKGENKKREVIEPSILKLNNGFIVKKIKLNNLDPDEIKKVLIENYEDKIKVSILKKQDTVIISGEYEDVESANSLIKDLDGNLKQVRISAQILDVTNNLFESLGFNWLYTHQPQGSKIDTGVNFGVLNSKGVAGIGEIYSSTIGVVRQFNSGHDILNLGVNMLETNQDLVVSARPSILVVDGEKGSFRVVEEVIVGNKKHENNKNDKVDYTPIFKEAGMILEVRPKIKSKEEILLDTKIELSNFKLKKQKDNSLDSGTFNSEGGSKVGRSIETKIKVKDGQTVFIGGLKKATIHNSDSKIPFLGTIPMMKVFFSNDQIGHETSDVYIKLKIDIVEDENCDFDKNELHQKVNEISNTKIF